MFLSRILAPPPPQPLFCVFFVCGSWSPLCLFSPRYYGCVLWVSHLCAVFHVCLCGLVCSMCPVYPRVCSCVPICVSMCVPFDSEPVLCLVVSTRMSLCVCVSSMPEGGEGWREGGREHPVLCFDAIGDRPTPSHRVPHIIPPPDIADRMYPSCMLYRRASEVFVLHFVTEVVGHGVFFFLAASEQNADGERPAR